MDDLEYLVAAYTIIWVAIAGYIFRLARIHSRLRRDIDALRRGTGDDAPDQGKQPGSSPSP